MDGTLREVLANREFRAFLLSRGAAMLAGSSVHLALSYQVYEITHSKLALAGLGLTEAIPAIALGLVGGHFADHRDRRNMALGFESVQLVVAACFVALALAGPTLWLMFPLVLLSSLAGGLSGPAMGALETELLTEDQYVRAVGLVGSSVWGCVLIGPMLAGFAYAAAGAWAAYGLSALVFAVSLGSLATIRPRGAPEPGPTSSESLKESISQGLKFVWETKPLVGSMALDLFAVLFGGAIALLPVYATDILHVGPRELGFLRAAPSLGAVLVMLWSTGRPPIGHAGRNFLVGVGLFGISMIAFGLSTTFWACAVSLFFSGVFDGVNMVIRGAIVRRFTPDSMRGRVTAIRSIFVGASNEIGAFESGVAAQALGTAPSVVAGGLVTLAIVGWTALRVPELRKLTMHPKNQG